MFLLTIIQRINGEFKITKKSFYIKMLSSTKKNFFIKQKPALKELMPTKQTQILC